MALFLRERARAAGARRAGGGKEVLAGRRLFMTELHKAVKSAIGQGKKLEDLVEKKDSKPVKTSCNCLTA